MRGWHSGKSTSLMKTGRETKRREREKQKKKPENECGSKDGGGGAARPPAPGFQVSPPIRAGPKPGPDKCGNKVIRGTAGHSSHRVIQQNDLT